MFNKSDKIRGEYKVKEWTYIDHDKYTTYS